MYLGQLVELAEATELCAHPLHPYTQALLVAALPAHPDDPQVRLTIAGEVPSALAPPARLSLPHTLPARHAALHAEEVPCGRRLRRTTVWRATCTAERKSLSDPETFLSRVPE